MKINMRNIGRELGLAIIIITTMLLPRMSDLDKFVTTDETIWLMRSSNFYYFLGQRDFENTRALDSRRNPSATGTVTMWVEAAAYLVEYPQYRALGQGYFDNFLVFNDFIDQQDIDPLVVLSTSRVIMIVLLSVGIGFAFLIVKRIIGVYPALVGFLLISFDPWYLALSRISHTDAPQATFQFMSVLAFISFMYFRREPIMLLLSGFFGGIAFLSKLPALISGLVLAFLSTLEYLSDVILDKPKRLIGYLLASRKYGKILIIWFLIFFITIVMFWPFAWNDPVDALKSLIHYPTYQVVKLDAVVGSTNDPVIDKFELISIGHFSRYPLAYLGRTTPIILLGIIAAMITFGFKSERFKDENVRKLVAGLFWFCVIYTIFLTIPPKFSPRYYLPVHLFLDLIAGIGLVNLAQYISSRVHFKREELLSYGIVTVFMGVQLAGVLPTFPYYFSYYNPLLGGGKTAGETSFVGHGEGLNEAAVYLNTKPGAENFTVMSWYGIGPFSFFFRGESVDLYFARGFSGEETTRFFEDVDYLVTYSSQWFERRPKNLFDMLDNIEPEYSVWINEIEYARIYDVSAIEDSLID